MPTPHPHHPECRSSGFPHSASSSSCVRARIGDFKRSANGGCVTCRLFLEGLEKCLGEDAPGGAESVRIDVNLTGIPGLNVTLYGAVGQCFPSVSFFRQGGLDTVHDDSPTGTWPVGYSVPSSTISTESFNWANTRLLECNAHPLCETTHSNPLPNRILYLGLSRTTGHIQLQESNGRYERYICLSHCWGSRPFLCTTTANLLQHREIIHMRDLPKTFRDAVDFCRKLGVSFLWIDSLCIVQDDENDWRREGAKMADVYTNAYLTIAATYGSDPHIGLFADLDADFDAYPLTCYPSGEAAQKPALFARRKFAHTDYVGFGSIGHKAMPDAELPLLRRGWVLQERLLSQRVLYFNRHELSWECATQSSCQCRGKWDGTSHSEALTRTLANEADTSSLVRRWLRLVQQYSRLGLTFERDMFPALSGLAKVFGRCIGTAYVAGIWDGHVIPGLLWHISSEAGGGEKRLSGRAGKWRAPTWSWASAVESIAFVGDDEIRDPCEVLSIQCQPAGPDPTGEIRNGELVLRGLVVPALLRYRDPAAGGTRYWNSFTLDLLDGRVGEVCVDYDLAGEGKDYLGPGSEVACLHLGTGARSRTCEFLILKEVSSADGPPDLPTELIELILAFDTGPPTATVNLRLTCRTLRDKTFYAFTQSFGTVQTNLSAKSLSRLAAISRHSRINHVVKTLRIGGTHSGRHAALGPEQVVRMRNIMRRLANCTSLRVGPVRFLSPNKTVPFALDLVAQKDPTIRSFEIDTALYPDAPLNKGAEHKVIRTPAFHEGWPQVRELTMRWSALPPEAILRTGTLIVLGEGLESLTLDAQGHYRPFDSTVELLRRLQDSRSLPRLRTLKLHLNRIMARATLKNLLRRFRETLETLELDAIRLAPCEGGWGDVLSDLAHGGFRCLEQVTFSHLQEVTSSGSDIDIFFRPPAAGQGKVWGKYELLRQCCEKNGPLVYGVRIGTAPMTMGAAIDAVACTAYGVHLWAQDAKGDERERGMKNEAAPSKTVHHGGLVMATG